MTQFVQTLGAVVSGASLFWIFVCGAPGQAQDGHDPSYVGSEQCSDCHAEVSDQWASSHHALAWTEPGPKTVIGDFDGAEFLHNGTMTRFQDHNGAYSVDVTEADGTTGTYPLHSVVGIAPLQQYLFETEPGRQQSFDVVWDAETAQWYHLYPDQDLPPGDGLHWSGPYKTWNARCAECHATDYERNYNARSRTYESTQAEMGVGCEACHGPASAHLEWASGQNQTAKSPDLDHYGFAFSAGTNTEQDIQQCAGCHSRRETLGDGNPVPGTPYHDSYTLALLRPGLYHADGQILDEVYVYGSFLQSKMYARGVGCLTCHNPHSAELKAEGNAVCTQCHSPEGNSDFPTLVKQDYDRSAHHFHDPDSAGAQCKNCHMSKKTYMGIDARSDHSFRIPRPDLGAQTGAPDACTTCHAQQDQGWAARQIATWYPVPKHRGRHYGQVLARGRVDPGAAIGDLQDLAVDITQPGIVRATALYLLQSQGTPDLAQEIVHLLADPDPLVRAGAAILQRSAAVSVRAERLAPLFNDAMLSVRIAAAKQMIDAQPDQLTRSQRVVLGHALDEWRRSLSSRLDFPETHLVLGGMALTVRNLPAATGAFREAVRLDPQRSEAWAILVRIALAAEGVGAARRVLREAIDQIPTDPALLQLMGEIGQ